MHIRAGLWCAFVGEMAVSSANLCMSLSSSKATHMQTRYGMPCQTAITGSNNLKQVATLVSNTSTVPAGNNLSQLQQHVIISETALLNYTHGLSNMVVDTQHTWLMVQAKNILIATGGRALVPPIEGKELTIISDQVLDLPKKPERCA